MTRLKRIERGDRRHVRVQQVWNILVALAVAHRNGWSKKSDLTYPDLAELMGYDRRAGRTLGPHLGTIGKICIDNQLPCLNSLVRHVDGTTAPELLIYKKQRPAQARAEALKFDWLSVRTPSPATFRKVWDTWASSYAAPPKPLRQIDLLRKLVAKYGDDDDKIVSEYANAERAGLVVRRSNSHGLSPEEYGRMYLRRARDRGQV